MRVLVVPEFYRPDDASANGTVSDAVAWIREWLDRDPRMHVYVLAPPRESAGYEPADLLGDRGRVTLVEAEPPLSDLDRREPCTETGYSAAQLRAIRRRVFDVDAYVDVVVDQLRTGRTTLYKWLLDHSDQWAAAVRPFDVVANVHDLQLPFKHRYCSYRNGFQFRMEAAAAAFADGVWFTAGVDADGFRERATFLADDVVESAAGDAVVAGSPIRFDRFDERYADEPRWFHLAGSFWAKKNADRLFAVAETLRERFGVRTLLTSMDPIPDRYRERDWVEAHGEASRGTYERALDRGDVAVCASEYETMARTPFEQAASGQVLVVRDAPWVAECVPDDHPFAGSLDELPDLAARAVEGWSAAVEANRRLVDHARRVRGADACGRRTHRDLRRRVEGKTERYGRGKRPAVVARAARDCGDRFPLDDVLDRTAAYTGDGRPLPERESYAFVDLVYTLRALGFEDEGNPGTPTFRRR
ncbi:glycosyltransferase family protein [Halorarum salinum]|uniref:Glycosyltransferase family 1 protein n=1 Tax=Halorarum salinum TaxID=2743089 RepID=A0A7D5QAL8_9EURY|nr:glycosyltransferase family 1 protein [Halobaculum salinum]QLG60421.1 glycosyltransferase family 1 protein [Halobaculum salinum]